MPKSILQQHNEEMREKFEKGFYYMIPSKKQEKRCEQGALNSNDHILLKEFIESQNAELLRKVREAIGGKLTPHGFCSDNPKIEKIVQDEKVKLKQAILKILSDK